MGEHYLLAHNFLEMQPGAGLTAGRAVPQVASHLHQLWVAAVSGASGASCCLDPLHTVLRTLLPHPLPELCPYACSCALLQV